MIAGLIHLHFDICGTFLASGRRPVLRLFGAELHSCDQLVRRRVTAVLPLISARLRLIPANCSNRRLNAAAAALLFAFLFLSTFQ